MIERGCVSLGMTCRCLSVYFFLNYLFCLDFFLMMKFVCLFRAKHYNYFVLIKKKKIHEKENLLKKNYYYLVL